MQDREDQAARGPEVELIAPGVDVLSTTSGGGYGVSTHVIREVSAALLALAVHAPPDGDGD
ncbi:hypothetical protein [Streptomyces pratensis]|uniref:hypothetical protein n=1 Tax=Streptomyces pratensis TaxID=1169025 RepID=UPI001933C6D2|nr:hypothetical protein [Streptomyces pratensis]